MNSMLSVNVVVVVVDPLLTAYWGESASVVLWGFAASFFSICECPRYSYNRKLYIKPYYVRKPSMFKLVALLNTDNVSEMQKLAIFIKRALMIHKDC